MRISKIKTKVGELCTPVSTELSAVVERMRSGNNKEAAERIATSARLSRLMEEEGSPHYYLTDKDRLPYLIFSATFGKDGLDHPKDFTNLLLLDVNCEKGLSQVAMMRRRVAQVPYTLLAFAGVSGVTLKVVVRCQAPEEQPKHDKESYLAYLTDAQNSAVRLYSALTGCEVFVKEQSLKVGCRMSHDPQLYYQPEALPLPVVREEQDVLKAYEDTHSDDEGNVLPPPSLEVREQAQLEYHTCLSKALEEAGDNVEHCVQQLADYCAKAHLGEEDSVERTRWQSRFRTLSEDVIRKIFRNAYRKPQSEKPLSQMNEKERIMRSIVEFFDRRHH